MYKPSLRSLKPLGLALVGATLLAGAVTAQAQVVVVQGNPPPMRYERVPVAPAPGYVWHRGHWRWNGYRYIWVGGRYYAPSGVVVLNGGHGYYGHGYGHRWHDGYR